MNKPHQGKGERNLEKPTNIPAKTTKIPHSPQKTCVTEYKLLPPISFPCDKKGSVRRHKHNGQL